VGKGLVVAGLAGFVAGIGELIGCGDIGSGRH
jgi:hypothetical protein